MWNMQSGKERRTFSLNGPAPGDSKPKIIATSKGKGLGKGKGSKKLAVEKSIQAITGLATDTLNNVVVASTLEGKVYVSGFPRFSRRIHLCTEECRLILSSSTSILRKC